MSNELDIEKSKEKIRVLESQYEEKQRSIESKQQKLLKLKQEIKAKEQALRNENRKVRNHRLIVLGAALENALEKEIDVSADSRELSALRNYLERYKASLRKAVLDITDVIIVEPFEEAP